MDFADAVAVAASAFGDRRDRSGGLFVAHGLAVAEALDVDATARTLAAAVLHDVVEDTDWTGEDLAGAGVDKVVVDAVCALTRREDERYDEFITRVCAEPGEAGAIARAVKIADLTVNLERADSDRLRERYTRALPIVQAAARR